MNDSELSVLPTSDSRDELENVRLLFGVQFLQVFVGTHLDRVSARYLEMKVVDMLTDLDL